MVMPNVLIPVDYSFPSHNAYHYGLHLARHLSLNVVLAHYYEGALQPAEPFFLTGDGSIRGTHQERLRQFAYPSGDGSNYALVAPPAGVELQYEVTAAASVSAAILKRARKPDVSLVVMATRSTKKLFGSWLGSTATTVSEASDCPVWLVPAKATYSPLERIVVANNHATAAPYPLWQIEGLAALNGAQVSFVHVSSAGQQPVLRFTPWTLMEYLVDKEFGSTYPFEIVSVEEGDISRGLLEYAEEIAADLMVVVNRRRKRWHALLHASLAQDLALRSALPVLVLHTDE